MEGEITLDNIRRQQDERKREVEALRDENEALKQALLLLKKERHYVIPAKERGNTLLFGVASDLHSGSNYERFDALHAFYDVLRREGVPTVIKPGDVLDGHGMYEGQVFEQHVHGVRRQIANLKEKHPSGEGIREIMISGNHDMSFDKKVDLGIGEHICEVMGWEFAGREIGWVELVTEDGKSFNIGVYHPSGGTAYALSYKPQRFVEKIPGGRKPEMVILGHFHKAEIMPIYRNVYTIQAGCFQSQTPHMAKMPTDAHVGGWIIEVVLGRREDLTMRIKAEWLGFYEPVETVEVVRKTGDGAIF